MSSVLGALRAKASYAFFAVGLVWLALAVLAGSALTLWPVVAFLVGGYMLRTMPGRRLTWAWVVSSAVLGLLLSAYQVYAWAPFLEGAFSTVAIVSIVGFAIFAVVHAVLFYVGLKPAAPAPAPASA